MAAYHIEKIAVSPEDAVRISRYTSMSTGFEVIPTFARAVVNLMPYDPVMGSQAVHHAEILMAIWTGGRIQGIREERQRRRAWQEARTSDNADIWKADKETLLEAKFVPRGLNLTIPKDLANSPDEIIDEFFNSLAPSGQRYVLISGLRALALQG